MQFFFCTDLCTVCFLHFTRIFLIFFRFCFCYGFFFLFCLFFVRIRNFLLSWLFLFRLNNRGYTGNLFLRILCGLQIFQLCQISFFRYPFSGNFRLAILICYPVGNVNTTHDRHRQEQHNGSNFILPLLKKSFKLIISSHLTPSTFYYFMDSVSRNSASYTL